MPDAGLGDQGTEPDLKPSFDSRLKKYQNSSISKYPNNHGTTHSISTPTPRPTARLAN
jgi:hypothetical protein